MNYIKFIETGLNIEINENLHASCKSLTPTKVNEFAEIYYEAKTEQRHPFVESKKQSTIYRPYFDENFLGSAPEDKQHKLFHFWRRPRDYNKNHALNLLYSLLIFSDELLIRDPLPDFLPHLAEGVLPHVQQDGMTRLIAYLEWLKKIRLPYELGKVSFYDGRKAIDIRFSQKDLPRDKYYSSKNKEREFAVNQYLQRFNEMSKMATELDGDYYLNTRESLLAYGHWSRNMDKIVRNDFITQQEVISRTLQLDIPMYGGLDEDFFEIIKSQNTLIYIKGFLTDTMNNVSRQGSTSPEAIAKHLKEECEEEFRKLGMQINLNTSMRSSEAKFKLFNFLGGLLKGSPSALSDAAKFLLQRKSIRRKMKAVGYIRDLIPRKK
ncbi:hypothetical protein D3C77_351280 [compost metagenome]|uniref:hypothetical protein n=1 Tax=Pseudomonas TaxID=286 RepID=UPI000CFB2843|nr:hypothetical protein [Pseudomonas sp. MYb187]PRA62427.1 hypothetical protein CQ065_15495 [Pseudomonas sp. MYb187]